VNRETRTVLEQAAAQAGKTLGQYVNENVLALAQRELAQRTLSASDALNLQEEVHYMRRLVENLTAMMGGKALVLPPASKSKK